MFIGNEMVQIKRDKKDFPFYLHITGSKFQNIYDRLNYKTRSLYTKFYADYANLQMLKTIGSDSAKIKSKNIRVELRHINSTIDSIRISFIKSNLDTYPGLQELYFLRKKFNRDTIKEMYNRLKNKYKQSIYGERIQNYLKVGDPLKVGDIYSNFEAINQFGESMKLSDFLGKYILLDFNETYCGPCFLSVKELKQIYKDYSDSINIVSFCADKSNEVWKVGLKRNKPLWTILWNGKGYYSRTILKYGVQVFPTFFLINPEGKIISKQVGYSKDSIIEQVSKAVSKNENSK